MKKETRVTHQRKVKLPDGNEALIPPIYRSVKFTHPNIEELMPKRGNTVLNKVRVGR